MLYKQRSCKQSGVKWAEEVVQYCLMKFPLDISKVQLMFPLSNQLAFKEIKELWLQP